jgi:flagellin-specific chaperone FliS
MEYATDNYISSYAEQLQSIKYPQESSKMIILVDRLVEWYSREIEVIKKSEYIHSKQAHEKSFELLQYLHNELNKKSGGETSE